EEKPVPQTDVPGEKSSPTQPIPTMPPPFARQSFTEKDINPYLTADEQAALRELRRNSRNEGVYTPPSLKGTIQMPGHNGGANWGSSAINPQRGMFFVVSKELPVFTRLYAPGTAPGRRGGGGGGGRAGAPAAPPEGAPARGPAPPPAVIPGAPAGFVAYTSPVDFFNNYSSGLSA